MGAKSQERERVMKGFWLPLAAAAGVLLGGCATGGLLGDFNLISPEQEEQLGMELSQEIARQETVIEDPALAGYVREIGQNLVSVSMDPSRDYRFYVLKQDQVNAFAIPGGHLYVMTGLIEAADNEAELAAVMAHELGHAEERHPTESLSRQMGVQLLMEMILGENPGQLSQLASNLVATGGLRAYSRSAELEADRIAVHLLNRAGYDPAALNSFFGKLAALEQQSGGGGPVFFSTHPPTPDRIGQAEQLIASFGGQRQRATSIVGGFEAAKARAAALN